MMKFIIIAIVGVINEEMLDQNLLIKQTDSHGERKNLKKTDEGYGWMSFEI